MSRQRRIKDTHRGTLISAGSLSNRVRIGCRSGCAIAKNQRKSLPLSARYHERQIARLFEKKERRTTSFENWFVRTIDSSERTRIARLASLKLQSWTLASIGAEPNPQSPIFPARILHSPLHVNSVARATMESINWRGSAFSFERSYFCQRNSAFRVDRPQRQLLYLLLTNERLCAMYRCARYTEEMRSSASRSFHLWISKRISLTIRWNVRTPLKRDSLANLQP